MASSLMVWSASTERYAGAIALNTPARNHRLSATGWNILSLVADVLELRAWRRMNPLEGFLLAAYVAAVAQPLVYGSVGHSVVALMTPVR